MIKLRIQVFMQQPFTVTFRKPVITLGRSTHNDLCLEDPLISRLHAEVREEGGAYWLVDMGSKNGTFLNGERIQAPVRIQAGDVIQMGRSFLTVEVAVHAGRSVPERPDGSDPTEPTLARARHPDEEASAIKAYAIEGSDLADLVRQVRAGTRVSRTRNQVERRQALLDLVRRVGQALAVHHSLDEFLRLIVHGIFETFPANRALLFLQQPGADELSCVAAYTRETLAGVVTRDVHLPRSIVRAVLQKGAPLMVPDLHADPAFQGSASIAASLIRSVAVVPVIVSDQPVGILYMDSAVGQRFTQEDLDLLMVMACILGIKVENDRLVEQRIENERIRYQLSSARDIQFRLLPSQSPGIPGYEITGLSVPCHEVGGDYFDFIRLPSGIVAVTLGDVSGKGFDAALLMASLHASVRSQAYTAAPVTEKIRAIHRYLWECTPWNRFVTLFYGELDPRTHQLVYVNAGHWPPVLIRSDGSVEWLESSGIPLGILKDTNYLSSESYLGPGDLVAIYSDGMIELQSPSGEEFGTTRLVDLLRQNRHLQINHLKDVLETALWDFRGAAQALDDLTFVLVRRAPE
ncbi:MAG: SpoIIE family protein phosphatase [Acidobacteria bacterium]|nr:SpoIIE family protein phosphatase [Acidobacteriota bacterium]MDW7983756.1 SpoIIE family protein phosphatase [Acidobacteriota bacterium]